jgi:hypothetical protein
VILSYNGFLANPGLRVGLEFPISSINENKINGEVCTTRDRFIVAHFNWYHHSTYYTNLYFPSGLNFRRTNLKGFFLEFSPEIGISRTFNGGTTYQVDEKGNIYIEKFAGYFYCLTSIGYGIGYDFEKTAKIPVMTFSKINVVAIFPFNNTILFQPTLEIGLVYKPTNFLCSLLKSKQRKK